MIKPLAWILGILLGGFVGYLAGYMKKKGESRAIHEDFQSVLAELKETTRVTKEIEDKISAATWDRQKRWELKRDVLFEAARRLAEADDALLLLDSTIRTSQTEPDKQWDWTALKVEKHERWNKAAAALEETRFFVAVVCEQQTIDAIENYAMLTHRIVGSITAGKLNSYLDARLELGTKFNAARTAIRKELGIEATTTS